MAFGFSAGGGYGAGGSVLHGEAAHGTVLVPDAELLFTAQFYRHGPDLLLVGHDGRHVLITGYFSSEHHPALVAPNGARLTPDTVDLLAGSPTPGQYAQAQPTAPPDQIGKIEKAVGDVTAIRNGAAVTLHVGDAVFKSDVIQTGPTSSCGISFPDGTALNLVANTRMAMNDYTFDANATSGNGALFTLVEGTFAFVAGKVAHTGDMKISTPVATMGIRGTTGVVQEVATITANAGGQTYSFAVVPDFGTGVTGVYDLYDAQGNLVATVSQNGYVTFLTPQGFGQSLLVRTEAINDAQVIFEQQILADLFRTLNPLNQQNNNGNSGSSTPPAPELFNPIPQLLQQPPGTPINYNVPGNNGGPSTPVTATVTPAGPSGPTTTVFWVGGSGNWDTALDWSDQIAPTIFSVVEILNPVTVTVSDAHTADGLVLGAGANLDIVAGGSVEVANSIQGAGTVTLDSSGGDPTLAIDGNVTLSGHGTITLTGTAADNHIVGVAGSGAFLINVDDTIQGTGTIGDGTGDLRFQNFGTVDATGLLIIDTGNQVANNGMMQATAGGTLQIADALFNAGTIQATGSGATVELSGTVTNDFIITATDGGTLQFENITVTNSGGGEVTIDALSTFDLDNSSVVGGSIDNAGNAVVTGTSVLHGDTVTNEGTITVGSDASLTLQGDTELINNLTGVITADGGTVTVDIDVNANVNSGTIEALDGGIVNIEINIDGGSNYGLMEAGAGGTMNFINNHSGGGGGGGGGGGDSQGGNYGTMLATGAGAVLAFNGGLDNFDQLEAAAGGTVNLEQGVKNHAGTILSTGDDSLIAISNGGDSDNAAKIIASCGGAITLSSVMLENEFGAVVEVKHGGTITYDTGGVTNDGTFKAESCGTITFGGSIGITNDATGVFEACSDGSITFGGDYITGSVTNDGGQIIADGGTITFGNSLTGAENENGGVIEAGAGGTVIINGFFPDNALFNTGGFIEANGANAVVKLGDGAFIIGGTLETSCGGVIESTSDSAALKNVIIAGGSVIAAGGETVLGLQDTTTLGGTVTFQGCGDFTLTGPDTQIVSASDTATTLVNLGTIAGAGLIGDAHMTLQNGSECGGPGAIDADVANATLTIDTGCNLITNDGTLQAADFGTLAIKSSLDNYGNVDALDGSYVAISGAVNNENGGEIYAGGGGTITVCNICVTNESGGLIDASTGLITFSYDHIINDSNGNINADGGLVNFAYSHIDNCGQIAASGISDGVDFTGCTVDNYGQLTDGAFNGIQTSVGGFIDFYESNVVNSGYIGAAYGTIVIGNSCVSNSDGISNGGNGIVAFEGGSVTFGNCQIDNAGGFIGAFTSSEGGNAGTIHIEFSTVDNACGVISALGAGDSVQLLNATIDGGVLQTGDSTLGDFGVIEVVAANSLIPIKSVFDGSCSAVTIDAFVRVDVGASLELVGTIHTSDGNGNGTINLAEGHHGEQAIGADLQIDGTVCLDGSGAVTLAGSADEITAASSGAELDNASTIVGAGDIGTGDNALTLNNEACGLINADNASHEVLTIDTGCNTVTNAGTMEATGGGTLDIAGKVDNTGGTIQAVGSCSSVQLTDATIIGGTLATGNGGMIEVVAAGGNDTSVLQGGCVDDNSQIIIPTHALSTEWHDTGIAVTAGEQVTISATGTVSISTGDIVIDGQHVQFETPGGDSDLTTTEITDQDHLAFLAPGLTPYSLVGQIDGGTPFEVGGATTFTATGTGELYLSINDNNFTDNSGDWNASVTLTAPPLTNVGLVQVEGNANLELKGAIDNDGQIDVAGSNADHPATLEIGGIVALGGSGTGTVTLDGNFDSIVGTGDGGGILDNVNNTISGSGTIGDGHSLTLINDTAGVIDADVSCATLTVDTGCNTIVNAGTMEATGGGRLDIDSAVCNFGGTLTAASGSVLDAHDDVSGGNATVQGGKLIFDAAASHVNVTFDNGSDDSPAYGKLVLNDPSDFSGTISGFTGTCPDAAHSDTIELAGFNACDTTLHTSYNGDDNITTVCVVDSHDALSATLNLAGYYTTDTLDFASDGNGGIDIFDPPASNSASGASTVSAGLPGPSSTTDDKSTTVDDGSSSLHDALAKVFNALTNDHGAAAPPASPTFSGSGNDSFAFNANLGDQSHHNSSPQPADFGHANTPAAGPSYVPTAADAHPEFAFDPAQHIAEMAPTAMDQFHQAVGGATLIH
jgi:hypothetical protein